MSRLAWTRYEGNDIEAVVSMFVCREFPDAFRIRPSRGDGGIDVCVPVSPGHVEIYQVKKFAENLDASQRGQIVESHTRIQDYASTRNWTIDKWHLTLPLDPTTENTEWFEELESSAYFPCVWEGLARVEGWAAAHRDIVDYYLRDGRERLMEEVARFVAVSAIPLNGPLAATPEDFAGLEPDMVQNQLATLRDTLNRRDPHFQYDIAVSHRPLDSIPGTDAYPSLVASTSRKIGDSFVTFHVLARGAESLCERPITFSGTLAAKVGSEEHREFEEFRKYGRPPTVPLDITNLSMRLPGGLGGAFDVGKVTMERLADRRTFERRLSILSPADETLADVIFTMRPPVANIDNTGTYSYGTDAVGFLEIELLATFQDEVDIRLRFHRGDPTGHFPDKIEPSLALVQHFVAPNHFRIAAVRGRSSAVQDIPHVRRERTDVQWNDLLLRYVRALITIQRYADFELTVPDLATEDFQHIEGVLRAARLIRGEVVEVTWERITFTLHPDASPPDGLQQAILPRELEVTISGRTIPLGTFLFMSSAVEVTNVQTDSTGVVTADLVPALENKTAHLRWMGEASIDPGADDNAT
ncbi:hypothetical protein [Mycobacterium scrofulaceum]|uniref:hypothetical protein n=1 Tax=Mycobacterium scrofulaceum TaxID=1783 RepID=UPI0012EA59D4|nr:hypothetical protein [Mycobacterium scrofulaceum]